MTTLTEHKADVIERCEREYLPYAEHEDGSLTYAERDDYPHEPDGCGFGTVYGGERGRFRVLGADTCEGIADVDLDSLWDELQDWGEIERVLRGELNRCALCYETLVRDEAGDWMVPNDAHDPVNGDDYRQCKEADPDDPYAWGHEMEYDYAELAIVGFDVRHTGHGTELVNVVTLADLRHWGHESVQSYREATGHNDPSHGNLDEWVAWAEGDTYIVCHVFPTEPTWALGDSGGYFTGDWGYDEDCIGGIYGTKYAEEAVAERHHF